MNIKNFNALQDPKKMIKNQWANIKTKLENKLPKRFNAMSNNMKIIVSIVFIAVIWMFTGIFLSHSSNKVTISSNATKVSFIDSQAQPHDIKIAYLGTAEPIKIVNIRPESDGAVTAIRVVDGQFVKAGDQIIQLDEKFYKENLRQAEANLKESRINFASTKALYDKQLSSKRAYFNANKELEAANVAVSQAQDSLRKTTIVAPFDGYISNIKVHVGDVLSTFQENRVAQIYDISQFKLVLSIPQKDMMYAINAKEIEIDHDDTKIKCVVSFVDRSANIDTKTFRLDGICNNVSNPIRAYETIKAFLVIPRNGDLHHIPKSCVILEMNGDLTVKTVQDDSTVRSIKVMVMDEDDGGFWVNGLPESVKIITLGQQFVTNSEKVDITPDPK